MDARPIPHCAEHSLHCQFLSPVPSPRLPGGQNRMEAVAASELGEREQEAGAVEANDFAPSVLHHEGPVQHACQHHVVLVALVPVACLSSQRERRVTHSHRRATEGSGTQSNRGCAHDCCQGVTEGGKDAAATGQQQVVLFVVAPDRVAFLVLTLGTRRKHRPRYRHRHWVQNRVVMVPGSCGSWRGGTWPWLGATPEALGQRRRMPCRPSPGGSWAHPCTWGSALPGVWAKP